MNRTLTWCLIGGLCLAGAVGVGYAYPDWATEMGGDSRDLARWNELLRQSEQRRSELDAEHAALIRRVELKTDAAEDLLAGKLTLRQAAVRFKRLNDEYPLLVAQLRLQFPAASDDERHCRNVIDYADRLEEATPGRPSPVPGLLAELDRLRADGGGSVRLD